MKIHIHEINNKKIAEIISDETEIRETQDALDIMANCDYQGSRKIVLREKHLSPVFFDLKTGMAGEILQKFSNYNVQLAIIGNYSEIASKSLKDFIYESNKTGRICFVPSFDEAVKKMTA